MENKTLTENTEKTVKRSRKGKQEQDIKVLDTLLLNWEEKTQEEKDFSTEQLIYKSQYGKGGEHFSNFPTIISQDKEHNPFIMEYHKGLPNKVTAQQLQEWEKTNGNIIIIPILKGKKTSYIITLNPIKPLQVENYILLKESEHTLKYTTHTINNTLTLTNKHYHITNIYTNTSKTINQTKLLSKLWKLGLNGYKDYKPFSESLKNGQYTNTLEMGISQDGKIIYKEIQKNSNNYTGKIYNHIGELLGREQHSHHKNLDIYKLIQ